MKKKILFSLLTILLSPSLWAQEAHWQCDPASFESHVDMTVYFYLELDDVRITDLSNYDIAAFCGNECRGFVDVSKEEVMDSPYGQIGILRVHANNPTANENITFKVYDKAEGKEINVANTIVTFQPDATIGTPSSPFKLDITKRYTPGDTDDDGEVTINDVIMTINASLGNPSPTYNLAAGDVDGDGEITINDVIIIINMTLQN